MPKYRCTENKIKLILTQCMCDPSRKKKKSAQMQPEKAKMLDIPAPMKKKKACIAIIKKLIIAIKSNILALFIYDMFETCLFFDRYNIKIRKKMLHRRDT